ncbi:MAG: hypothetical protein Q8O25_15355 [Sulfurisoma sp.]|nr:hypothetical protein [Sulfurisoma sp.]
MKIRFAVASLLAALAASVLAQTAAPAAPVTPGVGQRQIKQQQRIGQGVQSGQLTPREAARLENGQDRVRKLEDKAKADGKVTPRERARLQQTQNVQSRHIAKQKHDRQRDMDRDGQRDRQRK